MDIEQIEQLAAVIVTAGLVAGNFLLFTPWRNGEDPRQRHPKRSILEDRSLHPLNKDLADGFHQHNGKYLVELSVRERSPAPSERQGLSQPRETMHQQKY